MRAIEFRDIGKLYRLGLVGTGTLCHDLNRWWQTRILGKPDPYLRIGETNDRATSGASDYVWALKDITFDIEQGDIVGIIGKNGAGKSTLLKILSRVTAPSTGMFRARGRIASLLEVGTGFHPELTGRENIYMNGSIMGMTRREITSKLDDIVDFAGVARYLDTPVKRYSSGMWVRLGFAIAAFLEPDILVVDEVLAVGDAEFQRKAVGKMHDVANGQGRTVIFVSHNMGAVRSLCQRGIVLDKGSIAYMGNIDDAISLYNSTIATRKNSKRIVDNISHQMPYVHITDIRINDSQSTLVNLTPSQSTIKLTIEGSIDRDLETDIRFMIRDRNGTKFATLSEGKYKGRMISLNRGPFKIERNIVVPKYISRGSYLLDVGLYKPHTEAHMKAYSCAELQVDARFDNFGFPAEYPGDGFMGLESLESME